MKPIKSDIVEDTCPACNGTGFLPVIKQPAPGKGFQVQPDRYAVELVISGLLSALVRSKAVKVNILEDHAAVALASHARPRI